jgi:hypothetical protein
MGDLLVGLDATLWPLVDRPAAFKELHLRRASQGIEEHAAGGPIAVPKRRFGTPRTSLPLF